MVDIGRFMQDNIGSVRSNLIAETQTWFTGSGNDGYKEFTATGSIKYIISIARTTSGDYPMSGAGYHKYTDGTMVGVNVDIYNPALTPVYISKTKFSFSASAAKYISVVVISEVNE